MRILKQIPPWTAILAGFALWMTATTRLTADPTDDFSFSLGTAPLLYSYNLMSEERIAHIFQDHLDVPLTETQARRIARHLLGLCRRYRFDPAFILSLVQVESGFRSTVVSPAGAIGLMQMMPRTAEAVVAEEAIPYRGPESLKDPRINLSVGLAYLASLRDRYEGMSFYFPLAAFNIGPSRLDELRSQKSFTPVKTKKYYEKIKRGVRGWRDYRAPRRT